MCFVLPTWLKHLVCQWISFSSLFAWFSRLTRWPRWAAPRKFCEGSLKTANNSCFKNDTTIAPSVLSHSNQKDLEVAATQIFKNGKSNANCILRFLQVVNAHVDTMSHLGFLNCFEVRGVSYIRRESIAGSLSTKRALSQGRILCPSKKVLDY